MMYWLNTQRGTCRFSFLRTWHTIHTCALGGRSSDQWPQIRGNHVKERPDLLYTEHMDAPAHTCVLSWPQAEAHGPEYSPQRSVELLTTGKLQVSNLLSTSVKLDGGLLSFLENITLCMFCPFLVVWKALKGQSFGLEWALHPITKFIACQTWEWRSLGSRTPVPQKV